jgi:hypothetical protein
VLLCGGATKIFMVAMAVLVVAGLILAFALIIHRVPKHRPTQDSDGATSPTNCDQGNLNNVACSPALLPNPGDSGVPPLPLLNPQPPRLPQGQFFHPNPIFSSQGFSLVYCFSSILLRLVLVCFLLVENLKIR